MHTTQILLIDDLTGGAATETVRFELDGKTYEIDLNDENAGRLRAELEPFIAAARKVPKPRARKGAK